MKNQIRMLGNAAAAVGVTLMMVMALLPAGLSGARELDSEISDSVSETSDDPASEPQPEASDISTTPQNPVQTPDIELSTGDTTTKEPQPPATQTTTTQPPQTTTAQSSAPQQAWTEKEVSVTMYVNTDGIYSREVAVMGSAKIKQYALNDAVTVVALTDTDYYKLEDGTFIHADYLSDAPAENTEETEAEEPQPVETEPEETTTEETQPEETEPDVSISQDVSVDDNAEIQPMALEMFRLLNEYREQYGLGILQWDYRAYPAAQIRAKELLRRNSHTRPDGTNFSTVYREIGYSPQYYAENIVYYYSNAASALRSLMNSASHRALLLSTKYTHVSIAYVYDPNSYWGYYWVVEMTTP